MRITDLSSQYLKFFATRGASARTVECYDLAHRQLVGYLATVGETDDLRSFTPENIERFATFLGENARKASSVNVKLAALHSLAEYAVKTKDGRGKYLLAENPLSRVHRPKRQKPAEKYLYLAELKQLMAVECHPSAKLALRLLVDTALRASEVCNANVEHLTLDGDRVLLSVIVKGGRPRTITLGEEVAAVLLAHLREREVKAGQPLLVNEQGQRYTRTTLSELVLRLAVKAGITRIPVRAHVLRHSVATLAIAGGADVPTVAAMLNHSDIHTVQRYVHRHDAVDAARDSVRAALMPSSRA